MTASAQRDGGHGGGGWGGSHGGGYGGGGFGGGGSRGGGNGGGFSHESSSGSRSSSHYGTTHNVFHESAERRVTIDSMPHASHYDPHGFQWNHHDLTHDGFRWGYYHYDRWWRDDSFLFGFYVFDPLGAWVYSPWYYYPCLPPYIAEDHVIVESNEPQSWDEGGDFTEYHWLTPDKDGGDYTDLDYALQDLVAAFLDRNNDAISRLCPRSGRVAIYTDGHYSYSLNADNFYDTLKDGTAGPRTNRYKILDVKTNGHDIANVEAEQDYTDPWGKEAVVFHTFRMVQEGPNVVIRSFGTYKNRPW